MTTVYSYNLIYNLFVFGMVVEGLNSRNNLGNAHFGSAKTQKRFRDRASYVVIKIVTSNTAFSVIYVKNSK